MRLARFIRRLSRFAASVWLVVVVATCGDAAGSGGREPWPLEPYLEGHLSPLEEPLLDDAADGRWDRHCLLAAALVAGGADEAIEIRRQEARLGHWVAELARSDKLSGPPRQQAEAIFAFMHERILTGGYQLDATDPALALDAGRFNCVSGTVLFACLARRCGLAVCGLEIPGHAKTRLLLDSGPLDVETTYPAWFQTARDPARQSPADAAGARELSPVELVAMVYYNRGVDLLAEGRFAEAAAANAKAIRLDPQSDTARANLLAVLNNWAIDLGSRGRYREATDLLARGLALKPDYATFKTNFVHVHHQWVAALCRAGAYEAALGRLAEAARTLPGEPYFHEARSQIRSHSAHSGREQDHAQLASAGVEPESTAQKAATIGRKLPAGAQ